MKIILITSIFLAAVISSSFQEEISNFIVNGEDASVEEFPYMAHVFTLMLPTCGSAILTERSVVTAAHCLVSFLSQPFLVSVVVGSSYRNGTGGFSYRASRLFLHPEFIAGPHFYDVAVIRTLRPIVFFQLAQPIQLSNENFVGVGVPGVFTGWGSIGYGAIFPRLASNLQKMYTTSIGNADCRERYSFSPRGEYVVDHKLCVISGPRTSVCGGDSGGPLVINGAVAGVLSWRTFPCGDGLPDVFIRISEVRNWIYSVLI